MHSSRQDIEKQGKKPTNFLRLNRPSSNHEQRQPLRPVTARPLRQRLPDQLPPLEPKTQNSPAPCFSKYAQLAPIKTERPHSADNHKGLISVEALNTSGESTKLYNAIRRSSNFPQSQLPEGFQPIRQNTNCIRTVKRHVIKLSPMQTQLLNIDDLKKRYSKEKILYHSNKNKLIVFVNADEYEDIKSSIEIKNCAKELTLKRCEFITNELNSEHVEKLCKENDVNVVIKVDKELGLLKSYAFSEKEALKGINLIQGSFVSQCIRNVHLDCRSKMELNKLISEINSTNHVFVYFTEDNDLRVEGFNRNFVQNETKRILVCIAQADMSQLTIELSHWKAEYFNSYSKQAILSSNTSMGIKEDISEHGVILYVEGKSAVIRVLKRKIDDIHQEKINISQVVDSCDAKDLLKTLLIGDVGKEFCEKFEKEHKCKIGFIENTTDTSRSPFAKSKVLQIGHTTIELVKGSIAFHQADCLVNVLSTRKKLEDGILGKSFLELGGPTLSKVFQESVQSNPTETVFSTSSSGSLRCKQICHVVLAEAQLEYKQVIYNVISKVLLNILEPTNKSIAFPPLGVGLMYGYPPNQVAEAMVSVLSEYLPYTTLKKVEFVIYKNDYVTFDAFKTVFESWSSKQAGERDDTLAVTITSETEVMCVEALNKFVNCIHSIFLYEDKLITKYQIDDIICNIAKVNLVIVKKVEDGYKLKGFKNLVQNVLREATGVITQRFTKYNDPVASKDYKQGLARCSIELVEYMTKEDVSVPWHWRSFKQGNSLKDIAGEKISCKLVVLETSCLEYCHISDMVDSLWTQEQFKVGLGRDAKGLAALNFSNLRIVKVERIENVDLYREYAMARQRQFAWLKKKELTHFCPVKVTPRSSSEVLTLTCGSGKSLNKNNDINEEVNELYLFHGTNNANVKVICDNGLDSRLAIEEGMFGKGVYASESPVKADQYADSAGDRTAGLGEDKTMFLIRMTLGKPYICTDKNPTKYKRPPCTTCFKPVCREHSEFFDSVIGDNEKLFREFIVYEKSLCYPEYLITYNRV